MVPGFILLGLLVSSSVVAGESGRKNNPQKIEENTLGEGAVDIRSDRLVVHQKKRMAVFSGNVKTVQDNITVFCDKLEVHYASDDGSGSGIGMIKNMVFIGSVLIVQKNRKGHCERAEYHRKEGRIECTGDPWVVEGHNRVEGDRIEYFLKKDEVRVVRPKAQIRIPTRKTRKRKKAS